MSNKNDMKDTSSKKQGKSSVSDSTTDYRYSPRVGTPDPKASSKKNSAGKE